jgi:hypothetical protein
VPGTEPWTGEVGREDPGATRGARGDPGGPGAGLDERFVAQDKPGRKRAHDDKFVIMNKPYMNLTRKKLRKIIWQQYGPSGANNDHGIRVTVLFGLGGDTVCIF